MGDFPSAAADYVGAAKVNIDGVDSGSLWTPPGMIRATDWFPLLQHAARLAVCEDGEYEVVLHDGRRLRMSRRYRKPLLELLGSAA